MARKKRDGYAHGHGTSVTQSPVLAAFGLARVVAMAPGLVPGRSSGTVTSHPTGRFVAAGAPRAESCPGNVERIPMDADPVDRAAGALAWDARL